MKLHCVLGLALYVLGSDGATPAPTPAAPWNAETCAVFTGLPACTRTQTAECAEVQYCNGCADGTSCTNTPYYAEKGQPQTTAYSCCVVPTGAPGSVPKSCALNAGKTGSSACRPNGLSVPPTPFPTPGLPFVCDGDSATDCGDNPSCYLSSCNPGTSVEVQISAKQTGYKCCATSQAACGGTMGARGPDCKCVHSGLGSTCTAWPTPMPTPVPGSPTPVPGSPTPSGGNPSGGNPSGQGGGGDGGGGDLNSKSKGLTGGDVAGIVIAVLVVVGLAGVLIFHFAAKSQPNAGATDYQNMQDHVSTSDANSDYNKL